MNFKYFLMKLSCVALSLVISVSLVMLTFGICSVAIFQNQSSIKNSINSDIELFESEIGNAFESMSDDFSVPVEAVKFALNEKTLDIISSTAAKNFIYAYSTDFTSDDSLYNCFATSIGQYCRENDINISEEELGINSSIAVLICNKTLGGTATRNVSVFTLSKNRAIAIAIAGSVVLTVAAYFLLDFINYGRHRKYSYIGMGIITAGYVMIIVPLFVKYKGFVENFRYCGINLYNKAIADLYHNMYLVFLIIGIALFVAGAVILIINYRYFKKKGERAKAARESSEQMKQEYLMQYQEMRSRRKDRHKPGDRMVMEIDFDNDEI